MLINTINFIFLEENIIPEILFNNREIRRPNESNKKFVHIVKMD